jgi:cobalamin synthase
MIFGAAIAVGLLRLEGLAVFGAALALAVVCGAYVGRRVGGLTGDVYGAVNEVVEMLALLAGALVLAGRM